MDDEKKLEIIRRDLNIKVLNNNIETKDFLVY